MLGIIFIILGTICAVAGFLNLFVLIFQKNDKDWKDQVIAIAVCFAIGGGFFIAGELLL